MTDLDSLDPKLREAVMKEMETITSHMIELFSRPIPTPEDQLREYIDSIRVMCPEAMIEETPPCRVTRKRIRWNERNRRRRLKGLPVKQNPYFGSLYYVINIPVKTVTCTVNLEVEEEGADG